MLTNHYLTILAIHNTLRWVLLAAGFAAILGCLRGISSRLPFAPLGRILGLIYVSLLDTQVLVGILLLITGPVLRAFLADPAAAMKQDELRFFAMEHTSAMIIALALAHIGSVRSRRFTNPQKSYITALTWYGCSLVVILFGIPWWRPLLNF